MDRNFLIVLSIAISFTVFSIFLSIRQDSMITNNNEKFITSPPAKVVTVYRDIPPSHPTVYTSPSGLVIKDDVIRNYDYDKINDPLTEPTRRVPRHEIHPYIMKQMVDIPTRGYPDNYIQMGVLVKRDDVDNIDNRIIRLFGRQTYPGSYFYEYYTMVNSGHDQIKIPVYNKGRKELYNGDTIYVGELKCDYEVKLHQFDAPKYYPDILY